MTEVATTTTTEAAATESTATTETAATETASTATETQAPAFDYGKWAEGLADESKKDYAKRFKSLDDVIDGALGMRKTMSSMVKIPGKDAKPEDVAAFHKAIGAGEKAEDYKVGTPEGYEVGEIQGALIGLMQTKALETGIPKAAFEDFTRAYFETEKAVQEKVEAEVTQYRKDSEALLKKEHGKDFDRRLVAGNTLLDKLDKSGQVREFLNSNITWNGVAMKAGDHPAMMSVIAELGLRMGEDGVLVSNSPDEAKGLDKQIREMEEKYPIGQRTREQDQEIQALYRKRYPG